MGTYTRDDFEALVLLALGNLPTAHPLIARGAHLTAINNAPNRLIRASPDHFPEHCNNTWTSGPMSTLTPNTTPLPEGLLILDRVATNQSTVDPQNWFGVKEHPVTLISVQTVGLIQTTTTRTGWPQMGVRKGEVLLYDPPTTEGYEGWFRFYGTAGELPLASSGSTFRMHRDYDSAIVRLAAAECMELMPGRADEAAALTAEVQVATGIQLLGNAGVMAIERAKRPIRVMVAGLPTRRW